MCVAYCHFQCHNSVAPMKEITQKIMEKLLYSICEGKTIDKLFVN